MTACKAVDLESTLQADADYTIFAPSNEAFAALPDGKLEQLLAPENQEELTALLSYHIVAGTLAGDELTSGKTLTLQGEEVDINFVGEEIKVNGATVQSADVSTGNLTVHVIDQVVMPGSQVKN